MSRIQNSRKNIIWGVISKFCMMFFPFVVRTVIIKKLGMEYLGLNGLFASILQVLNLAELGISSAMVYILYEPIAKHDNELICAIYNLYRRLYSFVGCIILILGLIILPFIKYFISGDIPIDLNIYVLYFIYLLNSVISYFLSGYKESLLVANQRNDITSKILTVTYAGMYVLQIIIIYFFKNYYLYTAVMLLSTVFSNIIRSKIVNRMYPEISCYGEVPNEIKAGLKKKIFGLLLYKISSVFRNSFDSIVISMFLGLAILAKYQNYYYIMSTVLGFCTIISTSITASIGQSMVVESVEKNYKDFKGIALLYYWMASWCSICLLCLFQPFMKIWVGESNMLSLSIVILMSVYCYVLILADVCYVYRQAAGLWWEDKLRPLCEAILNLLLNFVLVIKFGVGGVVLATIISIVFLNIPWSAYVLFKNYFHRKLWPYMGELLIKTTIVLIVGGVTYVCCQCIDDEGIVGLILRMLICVIVPNVFLIIPLNKLPGNDKARIIISSIMPSSIYNYLRRVENKLQ